MSKRPTYAVFNANSDQANPIVAEAAQQGLQVRAISRNEPDKSQWPNPQNIETKASDLNGFWSVFSALKGIRAAFWHLPTPPDAKSPSIWIRNLIIAAHMRRLNLLVISTSGPTDARFDDAELITNNKKLEDGFLKSGLKVIVLRPTVYLENLKSHALAPGFIQGEDLYYPPISNDRRISYTSHQDQAIAVIAALQRPDLAGQSFDISSKGAPTGDEIVAYYNTHTDANAQFKPESPTELGARITKKTGISQIGNMMRELYEKINAMPENGMVLDASKAEKALGVKFSDWKSRMAEWQ